MLLASLRDCGKTYRSPFPVISTPYPQVADDSFLPPFPRRMSVDGVDLLWPQKQKGREKGEAEAWHIHTRSPQPELGSPTAVLHPLNTLSSTSYFSSGARQLTSSTSFLFHGYWWWTGPYSWDDEFKDLLLLILNWSVSTGIHSAFTQTNRSEGWSRRVWWMQMACFLARAVLPLSAGVTWRPDIAQYFP